MDKSASCNANPEIKTTNSEPAISSSPLWQKIRNILKQRFGDKGEALDRSWFAKLDIELKAETASGSTESFSNPNNQSQQQNRIKIKCPNSFTKDWIKTNYGNAIESAVGSSIEQFTEVEAEFEYEVEFQKTKGDKPLHL